MYKVNYEMIIKALENSETIKLIGKIDTDFIKKNNYDVLFYEFPLIERMVLEIYKLLPLSDVEGYQQGTMRTIMEILRKDSNNYIPESIVKILEKYYADNGLRNRLLHVKNDIGIINIDQKELNFEEIKLVIAELVLILRETNDLYTAEKIGKIETIK